MAILITMVSLEGTFLFISAGANLPFWQSSLFALVSTIDLCPTR